MTKAAILISAILLFAGVAAASSLTSLGGSNAPTLSTPTLGTTTTGDDVQREDQRAERRVARQAGDISGPCDEAEHANDPRCTGASVVQPRGGDDDDDDDDRHNRGPGNAEPDDDDDDAGDRHNRGPGNRGGDDDSSGRSGGNSGHGGDGDDD